MNASMYDWNVHIVVQGVSFEGPGMESRQEAQAIKQLVENDESVQKAEVIQQ